MSKSKSPNNSPVDWSELEDLDESDKETLEGAGKAYVTAAASLEHVEEEARHSLARVFPDYQEVRARLQKELSSAKEAVQDILIRYFPTGGGGFRLHRDRFRVKSASPQVKVVPGALGIPENADLLEYLRGIEIDGRPLVLVGLDTSLLSAAEKQGVVSLEDLKRAGVVTVSTPTPAWMYDQKG